MFLSLIQSTPQTSIRTCFNHVRCILVFHLTHRIVLCEVTAFLLLVAWSIVFGAENSNCKMASAFLSHTVHGVLATVCAYITLDMQHKFLYVLH